RRGQPRHEDPGARAGRGQRPPRDRRGPDSGRRDGGRWCRQRPSSLAVARSSGRHIGFRSTAGTRFSYLSSAELTARLEESVPSPFSRLPRIFWPAVVHVGDRVLLTAVFTRIEAEVDGPGPIEMGPARFNVTDASRERKGPAIRW